MFQTSVRVRPCSERCSFDSLGRSTTTVPSLTETRIDGFSTRVSSDLPLFTDTVWSATVTVTPLGILTGSLPILLMGSPNVTHDLATEARLGCFLTGHDAMRGREDHDPQPAEHARDLDADPRRGDRHPRMAGGVRVADPGQHVGDAIGAHDSLLTMTTSSRPGPAPARTGCGSRCGRCRTSACTRAGVHTDCSDCAARRRACGGVARG